MRIPFKYKFILSFVTIEIFFILCIVTVNFFTIKDSSSKLIINQKESLTLLLTELIKSPLSVYDLATLDNIVKNSKLKFVNSIILLDSNGTVLSKKYKLNYDMDNILKNKKSFTIEQDNNKIDVEYVPVNLENMNLGYLYIIYDMSEVVNKIETNKTYTLYLVLLEILISTYISYLLGKKLTMRLEKLSFISQEIGEGKEPLIETKKVLTDEVDLLSNTLSRMQKDIKTRNQKLEEVKKVFDNTKEAIIVFDSKGIITLVNKTFFTITGFSENEINGKSFSFLKPYLEKSQILYIQKSLKKSNECNMEINWIDKEKNKKIFLMNCTAVRNERNKIKNIIAIFNDITKEKDRERMIQQQSKLVTMGEMIGNIAHQWRQPLSAITSSVSGILLQKELNILEEKDLEKNLNMVLDTTKYLSQTIEDFRNFFRTDKSLSSFFLSGLFEKELKFLTNSFKGNDIYFETNFIDDPEITGFRNELLQAFLNILNNSKDAFRGKHIKDKLIRVDIKKKAGEVIVEISDNAGGIPKIYIDKIFEPYFTTKHQSQGTGIGLYMTHTIITDHHNGTIEVKNQDITFKECKYIGAKFLLKFPIISSNKIKN